MGEARSRQAWAHTSSVLALLANLHRDSKKTRAYRPADFNPHVRKPQASIAKVGINVLKQVFVNRAQGDGPVAEVTMPKDPNSPQSVSSSSLQPTD